MQISVIVPAYNVEKYLEECIDSVLSQNYRKLEVILVDDGSTDNSGLICDKHAEKDSRIKVIHKPNGGLSDARNAGMAVATGDYVLFLDADDLWADENVVATLVERITQTDADVLNFSYVKWYEDTGKKEPYFHGVPDMPQLASVTEQMDYISSHGLYIASACNKLIRRTLLLDMPFEQGVYSEDIQWCARLMLRANSIDFICSNLYIYRQRSSSIRHTINDKKCVDLTNNILACIRMVETTPPERKKALFRYIAFQVGTFFMVQAQAENIQLECIRLLRDSCWVLDYSSGNRKLIILNLGCKLISFPLMCKVIRTTYKLIHR